MSDWVDEAMRRQADEIDRLRAVLAGIDQERLLSRWYQDRAEKAEAAIARVRELCAQYRYAVDPADVLRALDGAE